MKLKALTLENFKGIRDPVRIEFSPITLLFGPNNAGKSTIIQALIYAREIFERGNVDPRRTEMGGDMVDLGGFDNLVHGHDRNRSIRMRFEVDADVDELLGAEFLNNRTAHDQSGLGALEKKLIRDLTEKELFKHANLEFATCPDYESVLAWLGPLWIELLIGWDQRMQKCQIQKCAVGSVSSDSQGVVIQPDAHDHCVRLIRFDLGNLPIGKEHTAESLPFDPEYRKACATYPVDFWESTAQHLDDMHAMDEQHNERRSEIHQQRKQELLDSWSKTDVEGQLTEEEAALRDWQADRKAWKYVDEHHATWWDENSPSAKSPEERAEGVARVALQNEAVRRESKLREEQWRQLQKQIWMPSLELCHSLFDAEYFSAEGKFKGIPLAGLSQPLPHASEALAIAGRPYRQDSSWKSPEYVVTAFLEPLLRALVFGMSGCVRSLLRRSRYLSSARAVPPRDFHPVEPLDPRRWPNGLAAWDLLIIKEQQLVGPLNAWLHGGEGKFRSDFQVEVQRVKQIDVGESPINKLLAASEDVTLEEISAHLATLPEQRLLSIRNVVSGVIGQPQDVGHGLSQLLPVIVAALDTEVGVVAVEEPESNIHPAFQVVLADLFITQAHANPNALFLIETHSEHLMLRCLRRIRETGDGELESGLPSVTPDDVAVHFVEPSEQGPAIHRIRIDEYGEFLDDWPKGFFRERAKELFG